MWREGEQPGVRARRPRGALGGARVDRSRAHRRRPGRGRHRRRRAVAARAAARLRRRAGRGPAPLPDPERGARAARARAAAAAWPRSARCRCRTRGSPRTSCARSWPTACCAASRSPRASAAASSATTRSSRSGRAAEETGALVFIHPTTRGFDAPVFGEHYLWNTVGNPLETTVTAAHLVHDRDDGAPSGPARPARARRRRDPRAARAAAPRALVPAAGALAAARVARGVAAAFPLRHGRARRRRCCGRSWRPSAPTACCCGSDHPFDMGDLRPADSVRAAGLGAADEAAVLGGNAARLLGLEVRGAMSTSAPTSSWPGPATTR